MRRDLLRRRSKWQSPTERKLLTAALGGAAWLAWWGTRRLLGRNLRGKTVVITGGSRGLGLSLGRALAHRGCRLVLLARDEEELERAADDLRARGAVEVMIRACDVSDRGEVEFVMSDVAARLGGIDVLINNASIIQVGPLEALTISDFEEAMAVDFWGAVYATMAVVPQMRARRDGCIVNIASIGGKVAVPHLVPYDCAKFALVGFSEGLHAELAKDRVQVTTVIPGLMRTGSPLHAQYKGQQAAEFAWFGFGDATPLTAMSAARAARQILAAVERGAATVTLSWQAKLLRLTHALAPSLVTRVLGLVNALLPSSVGVTDAAEGIDLDDSRAVRLWRSLMNSTAREYHQIVDDDRLKH